VVEGASLENWNTGNRIGGSNPSLSASPLIVRSGDIGTSTGHPFGVVVESETRLILW
jgi:hypothetical protein